LAVARSTWTRTRSAALLATSDLCGLVVSALLVMAVAGPASLPMQYLVPVLLLPVLVYIAGGFRVSSHDSRWLAPLTTGVTTTLGLTALVLVQVLPLRPEVLAFPLLGCVAFPVLGRIIVGRLLRDKADRMRWLVLGTRECLAKVWTDHRAGAFLGDMTMLAADAAQGEDGTPVEGSCDQLDRYLNRRWTGVVIANPERLGDGQIRDLMMVRIHGTRVYDLTEFYERVARKVPVYHLHDGWVVLGHGFQLLHDQFSLRIKRVMDLGLSLTMLTLTLPVLAMAALAVRLTSRGPILFRQERVGCRGAAFTLLKFRTMFVGSEKGDKYTQKNDSRITPIGGFMRRSRLDELPQLWNIVLGHMSFIGPRAEWTKCVEAYENVIPFYHLRHVVKPGLTGWAQVNYPYGASVEDALEKLQYDLYYIKNHSLWLDVLIILKTVRVVLFGMGR